jgi:hypothetical protein
MPTKPQLAVDLMAFKCHTLKVNMKIDERSGMEEYTLYSSD